MIELLEYASQLKVSPTGETVTPTQKLALFILIVESQGETLVIDPHSIAYKIGLSHVKSLSRLLRQLADMALISYDPGRGKDGKFAAPIVRPLPQIKRRSGNIQVPGNIQVTRPGNIQVTGEESGNIQVTGLSVDESKELEPPGNIQVTGSNGTGIALNTPLPNNTHKRGEDLIAGNIQVTGVLDHPAVKLWLAKMRENISEIGANLISKRVRYLELWEDTLEGWLANPQWSKQNIDGQINRYEKKARDYTPPPEVTTIKQKDPNEDHYRKLIYE